MTTPANYTVSQTKDLPLCYCFQVPERVVIEIIRKHKPKTLRELLSLTQAGHGCGCCQPDLQTLLDQFWSGKLMGYKIPVIEMRDAQAPKEIPPPKL